MFSPSLSLVVTFLLGAEVASSVPLAPESFGATCHLQLDGDKCLQLGINPNEVIDVVRRFLKDKDSYRLSELQGISVVSRTTGKTYKVKELGDIDVVFTRIRPENRDRAKDGLEKQTEKEKEREKKAVRGRKRGYGKAKGVREDGCWFLLRISSASPA